MEYRKYTCVIVDAYSTARLLAPAFATLGYASVHIQTLPTLSAAQQEVFRPDDFRESIKYDGDFAQLCRHLSQRYPHIKCIVAGIESGVSLADRLSERFEVASNGVEFSAARRDKYIMAETARQAGIEVIPVLKSGDADAVCAWVRERQLETVVLKPKSSSGTFGFNICSGEAEIRSTFARLHNSKDIFQDVIDEVLVQPLIEGQEFAVNCVSAAGRHYVSDIWRTDKRRCGQSKVYEKEVLVYAEDPSFELLTDYVKRVLTALRIAHGPTHTEVMLTPEGKVLLIESAARMMGALDVSMVTAALGHNTVQLTAEAYLAPQRLLQRLEAPYPPLRRQANMIQMLSSARGQLKRIDLASLQALPSFHGADVFWQPGDAVVPTIDSYSSPGLLFLSHSDPAVMAADYAAVRDMESRNTLYVLE
ncbi:ATP-grasp domain-containing protein [Pseudoduganella violacea]|uniref:L-amino acid ligase n=1 Tax=Pseudoduganella violacea TaxID=1715466 RepID=A0A7W5FSQ0_9BURK|nr:L-amino acid ligase [Pseudoduganella violacea]